MSFVSGLGGLELSPSLAPCLLPPNQTTAHNHERVLLQWFFTELFCVLGQIRTSWLVRFSLSYLVRWARLKPSGWFFIEQFCVSGQTQI
jgi:hypothetical protein